MTTAHWRTGAWLLNLFNVLTTFATPSSLAFAAKLCADTMASAFYAFDNRTFLLVTSIPTPGWLANARSIYTTSISVAIHGVAETDSAQRTGKTFGAIAFSKDANPVTRALFSILGKTTSYIFTAIVTLESFSAFAVLPRIIVIADAFSISRAIVLARWLSAHFTGPSRCAFTCAVGAFSIVVAWVVTSFRVARNACKFRIASAFTGGSITNPISRAALWTFQNFNFAEGTRPTCPARARCASAVSVTRARGIVHNANLFVAVSSHPGCGTVADTIDAFPVSTTGVQALVFLNVAGFASEGRDTGTGPVQALAVLRSRAMVVR